MRKQNQERVELDGFALIPGTQLLLWKDKAVELSSTEVKVLQALMENPGDVLQRDVLLTLAFARDHHTTDRNVDVHVSHIRSRMRELHPELSPIRTVWGSGYRWVMNG